MLKRIYISLFFFFLVGASYAQPGIAIRAIQEYQNGEYMKAKTLIDSAITFESGKNDPNTWQYRGFIYKDIYKKVHDKAVDSKARPEAVRSFKRSIELGAEGTVLKNVKQSLNYLASTYYNDAVKTLDTTNYERSKRLFQKYKGVKKIIDPDAELRKERINFYGALGAVYMTIYENKEGFDEKWFKKTARTFEKVLAMDPDNYNANYNMGVIYYNRGVDIAKSLDPDRLDILVVREKQEKTKKNFQKALPYVKKAYDQRPKRLETLECLSGIHYGLNNTEKSNHYEKLKEKVLEQKN